MADPSGSNVDPPAWRALVPAAQRGDRAARASLYGHFVTTVHAIALAHVGSQHADDVTQDVFCTVFASLSRLRDPKAFAGFLCTAARNAARDQLRRMKRAPRTTDAQQLVAEQAAPDAALADRELAERVLVAVRELPEAYRETLLMRLVSGLSGAEIAERTGMTHGSVRVNLTRGMAKLKEQLADLMPEVMR